jgi:DNA-binding NarL/FixJ family response regulator
VAYQYQLARLPPPIPNGARKSLTARETDMLQGLIRGESEQEMAHKLDLGETTVHTHLQRFYRRLDVHSSEEAVLRAFELRLVDWLNLP